MYVYDYKFYLQQLDFSVSVIQHRAKCPSLTWNRMKVIKMNQPINQINLLYAIPDCD